MNAVSAVDDVASAHATPTATPFMLHAKWQIVENVCVSAPLDVGTCDLVAI